MEDYQYINNGLSGLVNLGNTCFMNSCLQILSHSYLLHNELKNIKNINKTDNNLFIHWLKLNNTLWKKNHVVNPTQFHNELQNIAKKKKNYNFIGFQQNDAAEFLMFIFDIFHETNKIDVDMKINGNALNDLDELAIKCYKQYINYHKKDYSIFTKLFYFMSVTNNISLNSNNLISQNFQTNFILDLPIFNKACNIYNCLDEYFKDHLLLNENGLIDEKTKIKHNIIQKTYIWNFPPILIIALKRFSYDGRKNKMLVQFPLNNFNLNKYTCGYDNINNIYDLYGICNHSGVTGGGHYYSFIKTKENIWYLFNDTLVKKVSNLENELITSNAYCLFYKQKN